MQIVIAKEWTPGPTKQENHCRTSVIFSYVFVVIFMWVKLTHTFGADKALIGVVFFVFSTSSTSAGLYFLMTQLVFVII